MTTKVTKSNRRPVAVLISDVHYSINTYHVADIAFNQAVDTASRLQVPLIDCGDITNDKATLRAEYLNKLIETLKAAKDRVPNIYLLVGNHSLINEKGKSHSLEALTPFATIIDEPKNVAGFNFIPYQTSQQEFKQMLKRFSPKDFTIVHQGFLGAFMGDYVQDKSSVDPNEVSEYRIFSGHYHKHQNLGSITYVGSPYTQSFGEANDGSKGHLVIFEDGSYEMVETKGVRKHVIFDTDQDSNIPTFDPKDLVWVKLRNNQSILDGIDKAALGKRILGHSNFKLDLIPNKSKEVEKDTVKNLLPEELYDRLIDSLEDTVEYKAYLKETWREIMQG